MIFLISLFFTITTRAEEPPKVFIDKGACPFECCKYGEWSVSQDTTLFDSVDGKKVLGQATKGSRVTAITGEVHTIPGKIEILEDHSPYKKGDILYVLTSLGEGIYKVWRAGKVTEDSEIYAFLGKTDMHDVKQTKPQWAVAKSDPQSAWWVQIKLKNGKTGWTKETGHFGNMDACASPE